MAGIIGKVFVFCIVNLMYRFVLRGFSMIKIKFLLLVICMVFSVGCSSKYWYQDGESFDKCQQARDECVAELQKRSDFSSNNLDYEYAFVENCMEQKGYKLVSEKKLPLDAMRDTPETSLHWKIKGIAGAPR
jgi:hypothetical protein